MSAVRERAAERAARREANVRAGLASYDGPDAVPADVWDAAARVVTASAMCWADVFADVADLVPAAWDLDAVETFLLIAIERLTQEV